MLFGVRGDNQTAAGKQALSIKETIDVRVEHIHYIYIGSDGLI